MSKTVLKFERPGCAPCINLDKHLENHGIKYTKVNQVDAPEMFQEFNVMTSPTILVLNRENVVVRRYIGSNEQTIVELKDFLNE